MIPLFRPVFHALIWVSLTMAAIPADELIAQSDKPTNPASRSPANRGYTISKETTYFTGPLKEDGTIDFIAAINERFAEGVTPENNAALIIVPAMDLVDWGRDGRRERVLGAMGLTPEEIASRPRLVELRSFSEMPGEANVEALTADYSAALEKPWSDDELPTMRRWLDRNEKVLSQIASAARRERFFVPFVSEGKDDQLAGVLLEHAQQMRAVARMFQVRANNHVAHERWNDAWTDILTIRDLGRLVAQGQTLVEGLVGVAITGIACNQAKQLIATADPSAVDWESLRGTWKIQPVSNLSHTLGVTERAMLIQLSCNIWENPDPNAQLLQWVYMNENEIAAAGTQLIGRTLKGMLTSGEVNLDDALRYSNQMYDRAIEVLSIPDPAAREAAFAEIEESIQVVKSGAPSEFPASSLVRVLTSQPQKPEEQFAKVLLGMVFPAAQTATRAELRIRASQNVIDLALAARALQSRIGSLPESLRELEPMVEATTLTQPSIGDAIAFRADDKGIRIYHWCSNRLDDGGDIAGESPKDWGIRIEK